MRLAKSSDNKAIGRNRPAAVEDEKRDDHANVNFPPPLIHFIGVVAGLGIGEIYPLHTPQSALLWWLGVGLIAATLVLAGMGFREFALVGNPVPPNRQIAGLMTEGPFRFTRNPLYLALSLLHAGIALVVSSVWLLVSLIPVLIFVRYYVIAREEAYLMRRFGQVYLDYQRRVRRWV